MHLLPRLFSMEHGVFVDNLEIEIEPVSKSLFEPDPILWFVTLQA